MPESKSEHSTAEKDFINWPRGFLQQTQIGKQTREKIFMEHRTPTVSKLRKT